MATKSIKVPVGKTVSWYVSEEGYVPQKGTYVMGDNTHSLNINLQTYQEAPLTMVFSGVAGTLSNIDTTKNVLYRVNDGAWTAVYNGSSIDVNPGDIIQFKGEYDRFDENTCWTLSSGVIIDKVCGNIGSVLDPVNYTTMTTYSSSYALSRFFYGMRYGLIDAGDLVLPATTLTVRCYDSMFAGCALMTKAPALPATTLANYCYHNMFNNCDSLTVAPELPATTLANYCYSNMFAYCDGLTTAPDLLAETLAPGCYNYMFQNCSHLNYIKCMSHSSMTVGFQYTNNWVNGVAATGTFISYVHNTTWRTGVSGIPTGWVNQTIGDQHTITIVPTPSDATVVMNGVEQSSIYDWYGNTYTWSVSKTGYVTQSGSGVIRGDETIPVTLVLQKHTFNIVPTPDDSTVIINGEERTSITADYGTTISWSVSKAGYVTQSGTTTLTSNTVVPVNLVLETHTFTIVPTPSDATVTINGSARTTITADYGTAISWGVSAPHHVTQSGSFTLTEDVTLPVTLALEQHTFTINPSPNDATVTINGQERTSVTVDYGTSISWSVAKSHYVTRTGSYTMGDNDYSLNVSIVLEQHTFTIVPNPVDATVVINGQERTTFTADYGTVITWSVSKEHYVTRTGSFTLSGDESLPVALALEKHTFTIVSTPNDAMIIINGSERSAFTADYGTVITWSVSREGYTAQTGSYTLNQDHVENVSLVINQYTFTINTDSSNTVVINEQQRTSITADYGTAITWSVSKEHYVTQTGSTTILRNDSLSVALVLEQHTLTISPNPADSTVMINGEIRSSITVDYGTTVNWRVSKSGYYSQMGNEVVDSDKTLNIHIYSVNDDYFNITARQTSDIYWKSSGGGSPDKVIYYSTDKVNWIERHSYDESVIIRLYYGQRVYFKGNNEAYYDANSDRRYPFSFTGMIDVGGNILSLVYGDDFHNHNTITGNRNFYWFFQGINSGHLDSIVDASNLVLPDNTTPYCYWQMFYGMNELTAAPPLPATTLADGCYERMFCGCNLTTAPDLPAPYLVSRCYWQMFYGCTHLNYIKCLADSPIDRYSGKLPIYGSNNSWTKNTSSTGTFVKKRGTNWVINKRDQSILDDWGIPYNWTVIEAD